MHCTRIFSNPCPHSRIVTKDESTIQEVVVEEQRIHEHAPQEENLEVYSNYPYQHLEEIQEPWTTTDEEQHLEPEIEEFLACLSPDPLYIQECDDQLSKELHGMTIKEDQETKTTLRLGSKQSLGHNIPPFSNTS
jgi:hypothetical protein